MKKMKNLMAIVATIILSVAAKAQDAGTYIDSLNVQDSSYMEQDLLAGAEQNSSGNTNNYIMVAVAVVLIVVFVVLRMKKKK